MQSALEAITAQAKLHHAARVERIVLRIGTLAGVDLIFTRVRSQRGKISG